MMTYLSGTGGRRDRCELVRGILASRAAHRQLVTGGSGAGGGGGRFLRRRRIHLHLLTTAGAAGITSASGSGKCRHGVKHSGAGSGIHTFGGGAGYAAL
jgi:hypothetical protein